MSRIILGRPSGAECHNMKHILGKVKRLRLLRMVCDISDMTGVLVELERIRTQF